MRIENHCMMCSKKHAITLNEQETEKYLSYLRREDLIQNLLPHLNPMEREFLMTGYCPRCQKILFGTKWTSDRIQEA